VDSGALADLGRFVLLAALVLALYGFLAASLGGLARRPELVLSATRSLVAVALLEAVAAGILLWALGTRDYAFRYVVEHVQNAQPLVYDLTSLWGGMEGSLLLWALVLSGYTLAALGSLRHLPRLVPGVAAVCAATSGFFLLLLSTVASPMETVPFPPADGRGMNPLLLNPWMAIHPPALYMGYVGFTVPFAIVVASLASDPGEEGGVLVARRWMLWAWYCLSLGLMFGAKWSYVVLGWGGYWAWDPVENAALMPWLVATAFLHSVMIQERRGMLTRWNVVLVIVAFGLAVFGTFLTRSGILSSIHAFTQSPLGGFFLAFLALAMLGAFGLAAWRWEALRSRNELDAALSRESAFLLNNVLFLSAAFTVFLGTVFPLLSDVLTGQRINVGPPFFDHVVAPLVLGIVFLMGAGPLLAWRRSKPAQLARNLLGPGVLGVGVGAALLASGVRGAGAVLAFALCGFVAGTILQEFARGVRVRRAHRGESVLDALLGLVWANRRRYGGYIVHFGILLVVCGVTGSSAFATQRVVTLSPREAATVGAYRIRFDGLSESTEGGALVVSARLRAWEGMRDLGPFTTSRRMYLGRQEATSDVAIRSTPREDLYVILAGWSQDGRATLRLLVTPLVAWIWAGGLLLSLGALIALLPDRRPAPAAVPATREAYRVRRADA
jgi:cytochrome c-type biogenesis protein CcmF